MKKKILIFFAVLSLACCLFVLAVSAAEIPEWTEITEVSGMPDKSVFGADGTSGATSRVLMSDGKTYPAYYICKNSASLGFSYTDLSKQTGVTYAAKDVVRLEIPSGVTSSPISVLKTENGYTSLVTASFPEGFTTLGSYTFKATTSLPSALVYVSLPSTLTTMGQNEFIDCNSLEELVIPEGVTTIPKEFAKNATALKKLVLPSTLTTIKEGAFRSCDLSDGIVIPNGCKTIEKYAFKGSNAPKVTILATTLESVLDEAFAECKSLTEIYSASPVLGYRMFYICPSIETVILENTVSIGDYAFCNPNGGTTNITTLVLPEGLTSIGTYAFTRTSLTEVVLPSTLTTIGASAFISSKQLTKIVVLGPKLGSNMFQDSGAVTELVLTENFVGFGSGCLNNVSQASFTTYYTGSDYARIKEIGNSITTRIKEASYCSYEDYVSGNYTSKKFMFIYDINLCVAAFDGAHTDPGDDGDCTTAVTCTMCKEHTFKEAKTHNENETLVYLSFTENGKYYFGCTNDGCTLGSTEKTEPLFVPLGHSVPEYDAEGVNFGYKVNKEAIREYERVNGVTLNYGVFATLEKNIGKNDIYGSDGKALSGVVAADMTNTDYKIFKLKMLGFNAEQKDISFAMGAYVGVSKNGSTEYVYLQHGTPNEGEKYFFTSYSEIVGGSKEG